MLHWERTGPEVDGLTASLKALQLLYARSFACLGALFNPITTRFSLKG